MRNIEAVCFFPMFSSNIRMYILKRCLRSSITNYSDDLSLDKSRDDEGLIELRLRFFFFFNVTGISGGMKRLTVLICKKQIENQKKLSKTSI